MPFYEYRCSSCGHSLTRLQSMSAAPLTECPACRKNTLVKLISASGFDMKGVGVFGKSANPFAGDSCPASPQGAPACPSCPHAKK